MFAILLALSVLAPASVPAPQGADAAPDPDLLRLAQDTRERAEAPAVGVMLFDDNGMPRIAVDGLRFRGGEAVVQGTDLWHWGSVTKGMTATLIARLVELEVVTWDDTVEDWLGDAVPDMDDRYREVTFRNLLSHRGGLIKDLPREEFIQFQGESEDVQKDRLRWARFALQRAPAGAPGKTFLYSNNGVILAGTMLEVASGVAWETLIRREVFGPLGMESAGFGPPDPADQPRGHQPTEDGLVPRDYDNPPALGPAGTVHMNLADMARYLQAYATRREDFLAGESWDVLQRPVPGGPYGMGWFVTERGQWHNGSNTLWYAEVQVDPKRGRGAAVVVNSGDLERVQPPVHEALDELIGGDW